MVIRFKGKEISERELIEMVGYKTAVHYAKEFGIARVEWFDDWYFSRDPDEEFGCPPCPYKVAFGDHCEYVISET